MAYHSPIDPRALRTSEAPEDVYIIITQACIASRMLPSSVVSPRHTLAKLNPAHQLVILRMRLLTRNAPWVQLTLSAHAQRGFSVCCVCVCVSTLILALQATRWPMSDTNGFETTGT